MSEFVEYLAELFAEFGPVSSRRMFGGHGVFHDGLMIGLVADDTLYLKADKESCDFFRERGLTPFQYTKGQRVVEMSYYLAPDDALDDPTEMRNWAQRAYEAALRSRR